MALNIRAKAGLITLVGAIFGFLLQGQGPLGAILWPPADMGVTPTSAQLAGFMGYAVLESLAFGAGIAFLTLGYPRVRAAAGSVSMAVPVYLAIGWILVNWVPHDALHMHIGMNLGGLLALEWGFHGTLIACGAIAAAFFLRVLRNGANVMKPVSGTTATATVRARA